MTRKIAWAFVLSVFFNVSPLWAANKVMFEGYFKIMSEGKHVGYYIQKYELDPINKQFISTYFLRTNDKGGNISESIKAYSSDKLNPIKYQYTSLQGATSKTIDANLRKNKKNEDVLQVKINENGKLRVSEQKVENGVIFSTFLIYLALQGKEGLKPGIKYDYKAIAEEDGKEASGELFIETEEKKLGLNTFKILNTFKREQYVNFVTSEGESVHSVSPKYNVAAELVADPATATTGHTFNQKSISLLFGEVPKGITNAISNQTKKVASIEDEAATTAPAPVAPPAKHTPDKNQ